MSKSKNSTIPTAGSKSQLTAVANNKVGNGKQETSPEFVYESNNANDVFQLLDMVAEPPVSEFDYISLGHIGITRGSIDNLALHMGISRKNMAEQILDISVKTLERKTPTEKLDKKISSHAVEITKLLQHAHEVFGDNEKVRLWINTKNKALNNHTPISVFDTLSGLTLVNDILTRIEEGVYS